VRAPVIERVFDTPALERVLGRRIKHTIETEAHYRYVSGVDNFNSILRYDPVDVVSNTNEIEYSVTQNLFLQPTKLHTCTEGETPAEEGGLCGGTTRVAALETIAEATSSTPLWRRHRAESPQYTGDNARLLWSRLSYRTSQYISDSVRAAPLAPPRSSTRSGI